MEERSKPLQGSCLKTKIQIDLLEKALKECLSLKLPCSQPLQARDLDIMPKSYLKKREKLIALSQRYSKTNQSTIQQMKISIRLLSLSSLIIESKLTQLINGRNQISSHSLPNPISHPQCSMKRNPLPCLRRMLTSQKQVPMLVPLK